MILPAGMGADSQGIPLMLCTTTGEREAEEARKREVKKESD
jgi:hypothetical protein